MTTSEPKADPRAVDVTVDEDELSVELADGRTIIVPLAWFPRLLHATPQERRKWELLGDGQGIHWPEVDEDLSVEGLLLGVADTGGQETGELTMARRGSREAQGSAQQTT